MSIENLLQYHPNPAAVRGSGFHDPQIHGGPMRLADLVEGYWAITDPMYAEVQGIYERHMRGEKLDPRGIEQRIGRPLHGANGLPNLHGTPSLHDMAAPGGARGRGGYLVQDGVAIISLSGVIGPKANLFMDISGGASAQLVRNDILTALQDPKVKSAILYADSPGGNVLGIAEGAAAWRLFAENKPAVTFSDGTLASAAYWWGSAASRVFISGPMVNVGSIGVRTEHIDTSMRDAASGVKRTVIKAGAYKAAGDGPLDPKTLEYRQAQVDYLYSLFVDAVSAHMGVPVEKVLADMADGRVFIGQQAIDAGLVHGFATLEELVAQMADDPAAIAPLRIQGGSAPQPKPPAKGGPAKRAAVAMATVEATAGVAVAPTALSDAPVLHVQTSTPQEQIPMTNPLTREAFEQQHAALASTLKTEYSAAGAAAERERIKAVLACSMPGHEALVEKLAFDGQTTAGEAALQVLAAERAATNAAAAAHFSDAPKAAPASGAAALKDTAPKAEPKAKADLPKDEATSGNAETTPPKPKGLNLANVYARLNHRQATA